MLPQVLQENHRNRVNLFAAGTTGDPDPQWTIGWSARFQEFGEYESAQRFKCLRVAEKAGHVDQQILVKLIQFARYLFDVRKIIGELLEFVQDHSPFNPSFQSGLLVVGEIDSSSPMKQFEQRVHIPFRLGLFCLYSSEVGMLADPD